MTENPKISIISPSKNTGRFLKETIESIMGQTYKDWEHIVVDGGSTDGTIDILKQYPHIRWISEPDRGPDEAILKGVAMAKGEYIIMCCISDGFLNKNWFQQCVDVLDKNSEIALVWGIDQNMLEDGTLDKIVCNAWFGDPPPNGKDYIYYWLKNKTVFHETDMMVRKNVMEECYPPMAPGYIGQGQGNITFNYNFNRRGYLPQIIPTIAAYSRKHSNAVSRSQGLTGEAERCMSKYVMETNEFRKKLLTGKIDFYFRGGSGKILPYKFDKNKYLFDRLQKILTFLIPPLFPWSIEKLLKKHGNMQRVREIRKINKIKLEGLK